VTARCNIEDWYAGGSTDPTISYVYTDVGVYRCGCSTICLNARADVSTFLTVPGLMVLMKWHSTWRTIHELT
jgi:hypothetical protein